MRVLVTGGRAYPNEEHVIRVLDGIHAVTPIVRVIEGGACTTLYRGTPAERKVGADHFAARWATLHSVALATFHADWRYGLGAGPARNGRMLLERPDLVVAFPGGRGTADMCRQARAAGVEVREVRT